MRSVAQRRDLLVSESDSQLNGERRLRDFNRHGHGRFEHLKDTPRSADAHIPINKIWKAHTISTSSIFSTRSIMAYHGWNGQPVVRPQLSGLRLPGIESQSHHGDTDWRPYCTSCYD